MDPQQYIQGRAAGAIFRNVGFHVFIAIFVLNKEKENGRYKVNWIQIETLRILGINRITVLNYHPTKSPKVLGKVTLTK